MSTVSVGVTLVSFSNQLVIAMVFGATRHTDAYQVGISVPLMAMGIMTGLATQVLVPRLVRARASPAYERVAGSCIASFAAIAVLIGAAGWLTSRTLVSVIAPALGPGFLDEAASVARVSWCNVAVVIVMSCLVALHNASKQFLLPLLANMPAYPGWRCSRGSGDRRRAS